MAQYGGEVRLPAFDWKAKRGESEHEKAFNRLMAVSDALPEGEIKGAVLQFQVADNYAYYVVTKARPLTVKHIDWLDGYQIPAAHLRGLNKQDVLEQLAWRKRWSEAVARNRK
jgi:hypothetical protein